MIVWTRNNDLLDMGVVTMALFVWDGSLQEQSAAARASSARLGRTGVGLVST